MADADAGAQPAQPGSRPTRIVVIDDDRSFLDLMERLLGDEGYAVYTCALAAEAHRVVKETDTDLVVLDVIMSGGSTGWDILDQLRSDPDTQALPVIVCSAADRALELRRELLEAPGVQVLKKPFEIDHLLDMVRRALAEQDFDPGS